MKSNGDVGIWHETYKVREGEYECIYNNMPKYGLGKVGELIPATGRKEYAVGRITKTFETANNNLRSSISTPQPVPVTSIQISLLRRGLQM